MLVEVGVSLLVPLSLEGLDGMLMSRGFSAFARSSHLPRTASRLLPTRCDGVHLLVLAGVTDPLGLGNIPLLDCELLRESDPPPPREAVRSKSRVW